MNSIPEVVQNLILLDYVSDEGYWIRIVDDVTYELLLNEGDSELHVAFFTLTFTYPEQA